MRTANKWNDLGNQYRKQGLNQKALEAYAQAIALKPKWSAPWYNQGLLHKYHRNWRESLVCNLRAVELDPTDEASNWNLGIAATALREWRWARRAWKACGIAMETSDEEFRTDYGIVPVRLNPETDAEVVWGRRIDPARVILENIPYPQTSFRWQDIVLHDGAPVGQRVLNGKEIPVFNSLGLFQKSGMLTFIWNPKDEMLVGRVEESLEAQAGQLEVWSKNVRMLCKQCSEGVVHAEHDEIGAPSAEIHIGVAASSETIVETINASILGDVEEKIRLYKPETGPMRDSI